MNYKLNKKTMPDAIAWTKAHIAQLADGGAWLVPRSGTVVTVWHSQKKVCITSMVPDPSIGKVFRAMGWTVENSV